MAKLANSLNLDDVPPMVGIRVIEESGVNSVVDSVPATLSDKLFDTSGAVSRLVRSTDYEKRMVVKAAFRGIGKPENISYHWVVLRGDAKRIKIIPKKSDNSLVEILVPWHERSKIPDTPELTSDRVDIGVFVSNSKHLSAPAFISLMYPGNQKRVYSEEHRLLRIDHQNPEYTKRYTDPLLFPTRDWRDTYQYDAQGWLIGWRRQSKGRTLDFTRDGAIIVERDKAGRAHKAQKVAYRSVPGSSGRQKIVLERLPAFLYYRYANKDDLIGTLTTQ